MTSLSWSRRRPAHPNPARPMAPTVLSLLALPLLLLGAALLCAALLLVRLGRSLDRAVRVGLRVERGDLP